MILQHEARELKIPLDELTFTYNVFNNKEELPEDGKVYCLFGLTMIGGIWSRRMKFIEDLPYNNQTFSDIMPMILMEVVPKEKQKLYQLQRGKNTGPIRFNLMEDKLGEDCDIVDSKQQRHFLIPLYITEDKDRLPGSLMQGLICHIPVRSDNSQTTDFWVKRGTALVCRTKLQ